MCPSPLMLCGRQSFAAHVPGFCLRGLVELGSKGTYMEADAYVLVLVFVLFLLFFSFLVQMTKTIILFTVQQRRGAPLKTQAAASPPALSAC